MTTISRALVTIKHFKDKFSGSLHTVSFAGVFRGGKEVSTGLNIKEYTEQVRKDIQSAKDRITADFELRCKVNAANAKTMVKIADKEMSISDALTYRMHTLPYYKEVYIKLNNDIKNARSTYMELERQFQSKIEKAQDEEMKALLEKREKPEILKMEEELQKMKEVIDFFDLEFDAILTETNPRIVLD